MIFNQDVLRNAVFVLTEGNVELLRMGRTELRGDAASVVNDPELSALLFVMQCNGANLLAATEAFQ
ncbi:MAG: hypothetical protein ACKVK8_01625 [Rhodospirillales bacterium]